MKNRQGEDLCALCSRQSGGCCRTDPAIVHLSFPLSAAEWRRIAPYAYLASIERMPEQACLQASPEESPAVAGGDFHITDVGQKTYLGGKPDVGRAMQNRPPLPPLAASVPPPKNGDAVCLTESNGEAFLKALSALFPAEPETVRRLFPAEGTHLRLRTSANGSCVFQGRDGCRLPRSVRPWYCLLFPGWVQRNAVALFVADNCLAAARAKSPEQGLRLLGVTPEEIFALYDALRNDWGL